MMIFACVNKACFIFLQAMGKAAASTALSMIREIVFGVGFALLLPMFFGLDGVLGLERCAEIICSLYWKMPAKYRDFLRLEVPVSIILR